MELLLRQYGRAVQAGYTLHDASCQGKIKDRIASQSFREYRYIVAKRVRNVSERVSMPYNKLVDCLTAVLWHDEDVIPTRMDEIC